MPKLLEQAISTDDGDGVAEITPSASNPTTSPTPASRKPSRAIAEQPARIIGERLQDRDS